MRSTRLCRSTLFTTRWAYVMLDWTSIFRNHSCRKYQAFYFIWYGYCTKIAICDFRQMIFQRHIMSKFRGTGKTEPLWQSEPSAFLLHTCRIKQNYPNCPKLNLCFTGDKLMHDKHLEREKKTDIKCRRDHASLSCFKALWHKTWKYEEQINCA